MVAIASGDFQKAEAMLEKKISSEEEDSLRRTQLSSRRGLSANFGPFLQLRKLNLTRLSRCSKRRLPFRSAGSNRWMLRQVRPTKEKLARSKAPHRVRLRLLPFWLPLICRTPPACPFQVPNRTGRFPASGFSDKTSRLHPRHVSGASLTSSPSSRDGGG